MFEQISFAQWREFVGLLGDNISARGPASLVSNELDFQVSIPEVRSRLGPATGALIGVGGEQNLTFASAFQPRVAFVVDKRADGFCLQLMYKVLLDTCHSRAEFLELLFGVTATDDDDVLSSLCKSRRRAAQSDGEFARRAAAWDAGAFGAGVVADVCRIHRRFVDLGPSITMVTAWGGYPGFDRPTFARLASACDSAGHRWGFLATEANYVGVRDLSRRNLILPCLGDLVRGNVLLRIGAFLRDNGLRAGALYLSNVGELARASGLWPELAERLARLPWDERACAITWCGMSAVRSVVDFLAGDAQQSPGPIA